ncbi:MAG: PTS sugar transporter subunit IIC/EAL domain-containing protein [Clostridia bacterium]|nr:PTS sugar transporter subunit IIC/EAL domain-containing protein [Clostridia bacterium]
MKNFTLKLEKLTLVQSIRTGLVSMIPILIIGALSLVFKSFPIAWYQEHLPVFLDGFFLKLLDAIYNATFGLLSVYMTFFISRAFMKVTAEPDIVNGGAIAASLVAFFILAGAYLPGFGLDSTGPKSIFLAILTGLLASRLYLILFKFFRSKELRLFSSGADKELNRMLSTLLPIAIVAISFALFNTLIIQLFKVESFRELLAKFFSLFFSWEGPEFLKGLLFVFLSSLLWFFGIHGSDTLEDVMEHTFTPGLAENMAAVEAGETPTVILTKGFFDSFVLMGGCGATICLLIAILLFSRNRARRGLGYAAAFPMLFNINELMVFGLPIIYNPIMLIPFLAVPLVFFLVSYFAVAVGIVPVITHAVEWTTPIFFGGYYATGSVAGLLLQAFNLVIGVLIYFPFVRIMDRQTEEAYKNNFNEFVAYFKANESDLQKVRICELGNIYGDCAKDLCADLRHGLEKQMRLAYQPQYNYQGECVGVEALMRWEHPLHGILYPPLVVKLAEETGLLAELEELVLRKALEDREAVYRKFGENIKLSVNVTGTTVSTERYIRYLKTLNEQDPFKGKNICIEVTEQATLTFDDNTRNALQTMHEMGLLLAIDDFSMGQTSIHYLKDNMFDLIKLDGTLVQGLFSHANTKEIVGSIVKLALSLNMNVVAEFVEKEEEKETLHELGCDIYQGYLYSPAVFLTKKD